MLEEPATRKSPQLARRFRWLAVFTLLACGLRPAGAAEDPGIPYEVDGATHASGDYIRILSSTSDGAGNRYVAGIISSYPRNQMENPRDSGFVELTTGRLTLPDRTASDFLAKMNPAGEFEWIRLFPHVSLFNFPKHAVHIDPDGDIVFVG